METEIEIGTSLQRLIDMLHAEKDMNVNKAAEIVANAKVQLEDLVPYADFDHPLEDGYGRNMVYDCGRFEVMVMSWLPGDFSSVHNHGYTEWGAVQVFGHAQHNIYAETKDLFVLSKQETLTAGSIAKVNNKLIHQMGNNSSSRYLTLHLYGANTRSEEVTADSKIYELENGLIKHTTGGAFHDLPDSLVYDHEDLGPVDNKTFIYYTTVLLRYYNRIGTKEAIERRNRILEQMKAVS